jgi:hypothetical protein
VNNQINRRKLCGYKLAMGRALLALGVLLKAGEGGRSTAYEVFLETH